MVCSKFWVFPVFSQIALGVTQTPLSVRYCGECLMVCVRVTEVVRRPSAKSLDLTKLLSPNIQYFVAILRFVAIYAPFLEIVGNKLIFLVKNSVFWARNALLHGTYCIFR